jgi:hypothetical protein
MDSVHEGGCLCGAIRYRVRGEPVRAQVCHCTFCQRRTGSAFALVIVFDENQVDMTGTALTQYEHRSDESNRWIRIHFCNRCGTTVIATLEKDPTIRIVSGGTFDDPNWYNIDRHIWTRSAHHWTAFPPDVDKYEEAFLK